MLKWIKSNSKAIIGGATALFSTYLAVQSGGITQNELIGLITATVAGAGLTWAVPFGTGPGSVNGLPPAQQ